MARGRGRAPRDDRREGRGRSHAHRDNDRGPSGQGGGRGRGSRNGGRQADRFGGGPAARGSRDNGPEGSRRRGGDTAGGRGGGSRDVRSGGGGFPPGASSGGRRGPNLGFVPAAAAAGGPGPSPGPGGRGGAGGGGRGGGFAGGRGAGRTPGGNGGFGPHHQSQLPAMYGLANKFVFVELEKDGVWKVSLPAGQRFGKPFLAGLEVWAKQVVEGHAPVLHRAQAHAGPAQPSPLPGPSPAPATPASLPATATTPLPAKPTFLPPPPPGASTPSAGASTSAGGAAAHPITSLTGSGLPGLDTLGAGSGAKRRSSGGGGSGGGVRNGAAPVSGVTGTAPTQAAAAGGGGGGGLDFVSMLQAQLGLGGTAAGAGAGGAGAAASLAAGSVAESGRPPKAPSSAAKKSQGSSGVVAIPADLATDNFTSVPRLSEGEGAAEAAGDEGAGPSGVSESSAPAAAVPEAAAAPSAAAARAQEEEYQGLMASLADGDGGEEEEEEEQELSLAAHDSTTYQPYDHEDLEEAGAKEDDEDEEGEEQLEYGSAYGEEDEEGSEFDEDMFDYDDENDDEDEGEFDDDDDSNADSMTDYDDYELTDEGYDDGNDPVTAAITEAAKGRTGSAARKIPPLAKSRRGELQQGARVGSAPAAAAIGISSDASKPSSRPPPPPPPPPLRTSAAEAAAASPSPAAPLSIPHGQPLTRERLSQWHSLDGRGRLRVSLRLERQKLNDHEVELLADWYQERGAPLLELSKLWLFDNCIGDPGAAAVAWALLHPALLELHLSHNSIGDTGAAALAAALPAARPPGLRPLWLRLEWNLINVDLLRERLEDERGSRGLATDIPRVEPSEASPNNAGRKNAASASGAVQHDLMLVLERGVSAAVRLPWVTCQKQPPSEAGVLRAVKGFYTTTAAAASTATAPAAAPPPPHPLLAAAASAAPLAPPPPPPPPPSATAPAAARSEGQQQQQQQQRQQPSATPTPGPASASTCPRGPLLLFPDTSALLTMLGANSALSAPGTATPLDWSLLIQLAGQGRFGRNLPLEDQVFIVVSDSVMKQMDALKTAFDTRVAVRRFMSEGLEQAGPAGYDFLTVLGAHEGEGLALAGEGLGLAGSRQPGLQRGQAVDLRIVEVALYFQQEVTRAFQQSGDGGGGAPSSPAAASSASTAAASSLLPVILLSNDNAQIAAAKSHGLPAFRLSSATDLPRQLQGLLAGGGPLTSSVLRQLLAPQATLALGTAPTRSLQDQLDCAVGTLRGVVAALTELLPPLERVRHLAATASAAEAAAQDITEATPAASAAVEALREIRGILGSISDSGTASAAGDDTSAPSAATSASPEAAAASGPEEPGAVAGVDASGGPGLVSGLRILLAGLQAEVAALEGVARSHRAPSRLVQWAAVAVAGPGKTAGQG